MRADRLIYQAREVRRRIMRKRCRVFEYSGSLYHGSPLSGMIDIYHCGGFQPQGHGELPGKWLSVSTNDNMLAHFSDGGGTQGFAFAISSHHPLRVMRLDWLHLHLLANAEGAVDWLDEFRRHDPETIDAPWTYEAYDCARGNRLLHFEDFMAMAPDDLDGVCFPWGIECREYTNEAEIALTARGCSRLMQSVDAIHIRNREYEPRIGWAKIARFANRMDRVPV